MMMMMMMITYAIYLFFLFLLSSSFFHYYQLSYDVYWNTMSTNIVKNNRHGDNEYGIVDPYDARHIRPCKITITDQDSVRVKEFELYMNARKITDLKILKIKQRYDTWNDHYVSVKNMLCAFYTQAGMMIVMMMMMMMMMIEMIDDQDDVDDSDNGDDIDDNHDNENDVEDKNDIDNSGKYIDYNYDQNNQMIMIMIMIVIYHYYNSLIFMLQFFNLYNDNTMTMMILTTIL